jgi:hypothetical protein
MYLIQAQMLPQSHQFLRPNLAVKQVGATGSLGLAASDLIVHDQGTAILRQLIQHLKVVVAGTGAAVEENERVLARCALTDHSVVGLIAVKV